MTNTSKKLENYVEEKWLSRLSPLLDSEDGSKMFEKLKQIKLSGKTIYPLQKNIFNAFKYTAWDNVKVVILGQDPYHTPNIADGLAFSSGKEKTCPPSLKNILKEIEDDVYKGLNLETYSFTDYSLKRWAEQGVLLLNTSLTVEEGLPGSHLEIWKDFTKNVIKLLNLEKNSVIFLLWGEKAKQYKVLINPEKHYILEAAHPSPLSAHNGFFGCKHFSKTNEIIESINGKENSIKW